MDKTQFTIAILTNIAAAIIIWLAKRGTLGAKSLLTKGTIQTKVRKIFTVKRIAIVGSLLAALFNLWILVAFASGRSSFTRLELFAGITFSLIAFYWINRFVAGIRSTTERKLEETSRRTDELSRQVNEEAQKRAEAERENAEAQMEFKRRFLRQGQPRSFFLTPFGGFLRGQPTGSVEIIYATEGEEAFSFAVGLEADCSLAGWKITKRFAPISADDPSQILPQFSSPNLAMLPLFMRVGGIGGLSVVVGSSGEALSGKGNPTNVLFTALHKAGFEPNVQVDSRLPPDAARIVIGLK